MRWGEGRFARAALVDEGDLIVLFDRRRRIRAVSTSILSLIGLDRRQVLGRTVPQLIERSGYLARARERHEVLHDFLGDVIARGVPYRDDDTSMLDGEGALVPVSLSLRPLRGRRGGVIGAAFSMRIHGDPSSLIFRSAAVGMVHVDRRGAMRELNAAIVALLGLDAAIAQNAPFTSLFHGDDARRAEQALQEVLTGSKTGQQLELELLHADGSVRWGMVSVAFNGIPNELSVGASVVIQDVTERVALERRLGLAHDHLRQLALHDSLTGLPNRAQLTDRLAAAHQRANAVGGHTAGLFIDLDGFKEVNDLAGHSIGDRLLVALADRIRTLLRPTDFAARLGGDEFVIVCEDLAADPSAARREANMIASRVRNAIGRPITVDGTPFRISASIGVALSGAEAPTPEALLRVADEDMYRNKVTARRREAPTSA